MYEHKKAQPISRKRFVRRVRNHVICAAGIVALALGVGVIGYHFLGEMPWVDSLLNASMILGGMGPVNELHSDPAKIFASAYALFSGLAFIAVTGLMLGPFVHRLLHKFHWEGESEE